MTSKTLAFPYLINDIGHPPKQAQAISGRHKKAKKPEPRPKPAGIWSMGLGHDVADSPEARVDSGLSAVLRVSVACFRRLQVSLSLGSTSFLQKTVYRTA